MKEVDTPTVIDSTRALHTVSIGIGCSVGIPLIGLTSSF